MSTEKKTSVKKEMKNANIQKNQTAKKVVVETHVERVPEPVKVAKVDEAAKNEKGFPFRFHSANRKAMFEDFKKLYPDIDVVDFIPFTWKNDCRSIIIRTSGVTYILYEIRKDGKIGAWNTCRAMLIPDANVLNKTEAK